MKKSTQTLIVGMPLCIFIIIYSIKENFMSYGLDEWIDYILSVVILGGNIVLWIWNGRILWVKYRRRIENL
jgi:hypothetical protein